MEFHKQTKAPPRVDAQGGWGSHEAGFPSQGRGSGGADASEADTGAPRAAQPVPCCP